MSILGLVFRSVKGSRLTKEECDSNIDKLQKAAIGISSVRGFKANRRLTNGQAVDLVARSVCLKDADNNLVVIHNPASIAIGAANPVGAGGRDTAFNMSGLWVYFYYIWGSVPGLSAICSTIGPDTGPVLPSGYTHWAFATVAKSDSQATPLFYDFVQDGTRFKYLYTPTYHVNGGGATTDTNVDISAWVPPVCRSALVLHILTGSTTGSSNQQNLFLGVPSFTNQRPLLVALMMQNAPAVYQTAVLDTPLDASQRFTYRVSAPLPTSGNSYFCTTVGYSVPNGDN